jgi:DNA-binding cell septation regulator SpoVG
MQVTKVSLTKSSKGSAKAFGSVEIDGAMSIQIQVYEGKTGAFVGWPGYKNAKDSKWYSSVMLIDESAKSTINGAILQKYSAMVGDEQQAPRESQPERQGVPF